MLAAAYLVCQNLVPEYTPFTTGECKTSAHKVYQSSIIIIIIIIIIMIIIIIIGFISRG